MSKWVFANFWTRAPNWILIEIPWSKNFSGSESIKKISKFDQTSILKSRFWGQMDIFEIFSLSSKTIINRLFGMIFDPKERKWPKILIFGPEKVDFWRELIFRLLKKCKKMPMMGFEPEPTGHPSCSITTVPRYPDVRYSREQSVCAYDGKVGSMFCAQLEFSRL